MTNNLHRQKKKILFLIILSAFMLSLISIGPIFAEDSERVKELNNQIRELEERIENSKKQVVTLAGQIDYMENQIQLTEARIQQAQERLASLKIEINDLIIKINKQEITLDELSKILLVRIEQTYKQGKVEPWQMIFSSKNFSEFILRLRYLQIAQEHDKKVMTEVETTKVNYQNQKQLLEEKRKEEETLKVQLEGYTALLLTQKSDKEYLLEITSRDQATYEVELKALLAERAALDVINAGLGEEIFLKDVNEGDEIGSLISGQSACSTGTHLHFQINDGRENPADYLRSINFINETDGDGINLSGNWNWPINETVVITQGFGMTNFARSCFYGRDTNGNCRPHNAIDMYSKSDLKVKAVKKGKLYTGSTPCGGGILYYAKVEHEDGTKTYYLHMYAK